MIDLPAEGGLDGPVLVHTSDLHISTLDDVTSILSPVLGITSAVSAAALLLVGDVFDSNRVAEATVHAAREALEALGRPVVILPGNHDCLGPGSCYSRGGFPEAARITVLGAPADDVVLADSAVQIWGVAHNDRAGLHVMPTARQRVVRWQVVVAHGHFTERADERYSWPIRPADLVATEVDYVALGHWDHRAQVSDKPLAWYSGAPHQVGTVNVVRFSERCGVSVHPTETIPAMPANEYH